MKIATDFSYYQACGGLRDHWYPVIFSDLIKPMQSIRRVVLGVPLMIWRDASGNPYGAVDVCPHRQAPLSEGSLKDGTVQCPYHGWEFSFDGQCTRIPSMPNETTACRKTTLSTAIVRESCGMLWVWMGQNEATTSIPMDPAQYTGPGRKLVRLHQTFDAHVEDLIENFMDSPHTAFVHAGIIRGAGKLHPREVTIRSDAQMVRIEHAPSEEKLGLLNPFINPHHELVRHYDTFVVPSHVRVDYWFGEHGSEFNAFLGMTPINDHQTEVFITLSIRFGWLNLPFAFALRRLAQRVVAQDVAILGKQRQNLALMNARRPRSIKTDIADIQVRKLRRYLRDPSTSKHVPKATSRDMKVHL